MPMHIPVPPWFQEAPVYWLGFYALSFAIGGWIGHKIKKRREAHQAALEQASWEEAV
jgi:hypothetical protein